MTFLINIYSSNILIISPSLSLSLINKMGQLADLLVINGHNVTVFIPEMDKIEENGTKLAQQIIRMNGIVNSLEELINSDIFNEEIPSFKIRRTQDEGMNELEILKNSNFDLAFSNMIDYCFQGIIKYLGIEKQIWFSTGPLPEGILWFLGIPLPLSISPLLQTTTLLGPKMNIKERVKNIWQFVLSFYSEMQILKKENELFNLYISKDFPSLDKIISEIDLVFTYNDEFLDPALPTLTKVIPIGGLGINSSNFSKNNLDIKLVKAIESGKKGSIIFSLGTITNTKFLNKEKWGNILKSFLYFKEYSFIFKWFPQFDLLGHPNIKLIITHGGYNSLLESTIRTIPVLIIPLFFDQLRNAKCAEYRGNGRILTRNDLLNIKKIKEEINEMLINQSYKNNAKRLSTLYNQKPNKPNESVIKWTEFVIANGPIKELIPENVKITLLEYYCLDILFFCLLFFILIIYILIKLFKLLNNLKKQKNE
ncbi:UDPGT domain-containing protein [Meloidogyne graminicola]|uniref:glucuronosyltransferase n=1 Tax=Meloidogyne graminicola TaxID=189291 RepID=A0A8S9ZR71_9BILA|nr:UDPGT domain-containing protein [Meloidogyne graminicola]